MQITLIAKTKKFSQKFERDLYWYDTEKKEMKTFKGGNIKFNYIYDAELNKYRMMPKIVDDNKIVYKRDYDELNNWFEKNAERFKLLKIDDRPGYSMTLEFPEDVLFDVEHELYESKITYD